MSIKDKVQNFGIQHPKLFTLGVSLTITFVIGIAIWLDIYNYCQPICSRSGRIITS